MSRDSARRACVGVVLALALLAGAASAEAHDSSTRGTPHSQAPAVVVATFDTGINPFHPCLRRPGLTHPRQRTPGYPSTSTPLRLSFRSSYAASLAASKPALDGIKPWTLHHVPGTNVSFYGGTHARTELVDDEDHGGKAASQIGCAQFGLAPDAQLVVLNWYDDPAAEERLVSWVAAQPWIDVVHLNIQDVPAPVSRQSPAPQLSHEGIKKLIAAGKLVVVAAGNGVAGSGAAYPTELSKYDAPEGALVVGADDNGGYALFSNLDPHVVMDGMNTPAAESAGFGTSLFNGTSSSSPLAAGYVARLIADCRLRLGHTGTGLVTIPAGRSRPRTGPLADGRLTAAELHEVVRATANPNPHESRFDGPDAGAGNPYKPIPQPVDLPASFYPKMGYGEISDRTAPIALAVLLGERPLPGRPVEDRLFEISESLRH
jgi:hypothetical protein